MRSRAIAAAAAICFAGASAVAELHVGEKAPAFEGKEFINTGKCSLTSLRGRVVLLQTFLTFIDACDRDVPRMNELWAKYKDKGVALIAVTHASKPSAEAFAAKNGAVFPIVLESGDSHVSFDGSLYPDHFVIAPDGRIAANDGFDEKLIDGLIAKQRIAPTLPKNLGASVQKLLDQDKVADARKALAAAAAGTLADADRTAVTSFIQWIDDGGSAAMATAEEFKSGGDYADAVAAYEELVRWYAGLDAATKASDALKSLLSDPGRRETVAEKALERARRAAMPLVDRAAAISIYRAVAEKWKGTKAGAEAARVAKGLAEK